VSCWHELSDQYQENLVRSLQKAFRSTTIPAEILQALLNLAEFMEHDVEALPISLSILAELAQKGHAYAKALHYRELEFQTNPAGCFESLININKKLDQYDAASGLLKVVEQIQKKFPALKEVYAVQESWLAKLGHWDEALVKYDAKLAVTPKDSKVLAGKMKCLDALGRWEEAIRICEDNLELMRVESEQAGAKTLTKAAVIGARAAWSLNQWDRMDLFLTQLPGAFLQSCSLPILCCVR
jgi:FKBP12-rapamycin complex-associated protein